MSNVAKCPKIIEKDLIMRILVAFKKTVLDIESRLRIESDEVVKPSNIV